MKRLLRSTRLRRTAIAAHRRFGHWLPGPLLMLAKQALFPGRMELLIDVVGACNLRCPSCPVGNMGPINPAGLIDKALLGRVMAKAARVHNVFRVSLYNWGEPLLHPELPALVRLVKAHGMYCALSSNLNVLRDPEGLLEAAPNELRISLSGFSQETYGQTHARGDIETVKVNMRRLSEARRATGARTEIHVYFHKYTHNLHEMAPMRGLAEELGFNWMENWAYFMPMEKVADLAEGRLGPVESAFVKKQFVLPILDAITAAKAVRHEPCRLLEEQIVLDLQGNVILCCSVYDYDKNRVGSFLELSPADLRRAKDNHPTCTRCTSHGLHRYGEYYDHPVLRPAYDRLAAENLARLHKAETASP